MSVVAHRFYLMVQRGEDPCAGDAPAMCWRLRGRWVGLAVALIALVAGQGLFGPSLSAATVEAAGPDARGAALGLQQSAGALGRIVGPLLAGTLFGRVSVAAPYLVAAMLAVVAMSIVPPRVRREPTAEA